MEQNEERATHVVYEKDEHGQIVIADEVVAIIAGIAATEVKGVDSMYGGWSGEIISRMGIRDLSKGVSISIEDGHVSVKLSLNVRYGYSIPDVSRNVQDKVASAIESMTGLSVLDVNIRIAGVVNAENE
ncbi:Asp23/Gls24 family envelope stress response protein [Oribacterium sp. P9]|uniref:Asp23/Gls24 family envelope stress response protein n=1 Tax=unclassified Oribacterium TaxID=2629782 RepID=UPI002A77264D|nr:Asp23/Gls24 family envelope stress response protein [Oribacterium sp.]MDD6520387.1 Asp23/Gls24 family envelope stress response protein [Oribacterium sp.]MDY2854036.1 Asp23/Gls24 family envelope stress response protein [Oliverpabstia sp.]MEE1377896.1 Asp23/Gls24 family envelope stress response protein [Oribacterium sp.]